MSRSPRPYHLGLVKESLTGFEAIAADAAAWVAVIGAVAIEFRLFHQGRKQEGKQRLAALGLSAMDGDQASTSLRLMASISHPRK